nr:hypothetical protein [Halomonas sp. 1513]
MLKNDLVFIDGSHLPQDLFYRLWKLSFYEARSLGRNETANILGGAFFLGEMENGLCFGFMYDLEGSTPHEPDLWTQTLRKLENEEIIDLFEFQVLLECGRHVEAIYKEETGIDSSGWMYIVFVEPPDDPDLCSFKGLHRFWSYEDLDRR